MNKKIQNLLLIIGSLLIIEDIINIYGISEFKNLTFLNDLKSFFEKSNLNSRDFIIFKINN